MKGDDPVEAEALSNRSISSTCSHNNFMFKKNSAFWNGNSKANPIRPETTVSQLFDQGMGVEPLRSMRASMS